jgi:hypothetical protein
MWLTRPRLVGALPPLPMLIACASAGATARDAYVITALELNRSRSTNTDAAIRRVRPELLRSRQPGSVLYFTTRTPVASLDHNPPVVPALRCWEPRPSTWWPGSNT